jgi:hypothetical protein
MEPIPADVVFPRMLQGRAMSSLYASIAPKPFEGFGHAVRRRRKTSFLTVYGWFVMLALGAVALGAGAAFII